MKYDQYGRSFTDSNELCDLLYKNPALDLNLFLVEDPQEFNKSRSELHAEVPNLFGYVTLADSIIEFDQRYQRKWRMPDDYKQLDIAAYILGLCQEEHELQRVGQELLLYQERDLFNLLRYLKYLVDTLRKNNLVWGVGRGSSVASYVLFLLGVHKINSIYYDLSIDEFLK
jgi:DNA polymerase III alpha subunit